VGVEKRRRRRRAEQHPCLPRRDALDREEIPIPHERRVLIFDLDRSEHLPRALIARLARSVIH
jgi:hypothetical protein